MRLQDAATLTLRFAGCARATQRRPSRFSFLCFISSCALPVIDSNTLQSSLLRSGGYRAARRFAPVRGFVPARAPSLRSILPQLVAGLGKQVVTLVTIGPRRDTEKDRKVFLPRAVLGLLSPLTAAAREIVRRLVLTLAASQSYAS